MNLLDFTFGEVIFWQGDVYQDLHTIRRDIVQLFKLFPKGP